MKNDKIYSKFYNRIYNPEQKIQFIEEEYPLVDNTKKLILSNFAKSYDIEKQFNKDLCLFNSKELQEVAARLGYVTENVIQSAFSFFSSYIDWCIKKGLRGKYENGINDAYNFLTTQDLSVYVSKIKAMHRYLTTDEMHVMVDALVNYVDKAIILGLFEGIAGEQWHELRSLKIDNVDFHTNQVELTDNKGDKRTIVVSDKLKNILKYADRQQEYVMANGESMRDGTRILADSPYIIRSLKRGENHNEMMKYYAITNRIQKIKGYVGGKYNREKDNTRKYLAYNFVTAKSIQDSGAMNRVVEIAKTNGRNEPAHEDFMQLKKPSEYNLSDMQVYSLRQKFNLVKTMKDFQ